jgi:protein-tyrosine kinase
MSRIEEALEKAAQMRNSKRDFVAPGKAAAHIAQPVTTRYAVPEAAGTPLQSPMLVTATDPHSPVAEEYRKLKSMIVSLTRQETFRNTLMVTSSLAGEGKSVTSLNLAISLAQEFDHTVLLVDADLRKPSLHQYFGLDPKIGLADCLRDGVDPGDVLIKTGIGKLTLLPAGKPVRNPVELMSSQRMSELLQEMKHRYPDRYIIIDTPPVLLFAETLALSYLVDGVIFLVKEGLASVQNITDALANLKGTPILGMVYNNVSQESLDSRYYYYYGDRSASQIPEKKGLLRRMLGR